MIQGDCRKALAEMLDRFLYHRGFSAARRFSAFRDGGLGGQGVCAMQAASDGPGLKRVANMPAIEAQLKEIAKHYDENIKGYWNFNDMYHLLDFVPEAEAILLAEKVFDLLRHEISFEPKK